VRRIYFTVTNDLSFDQRMHRICGSLADAGYRITLVGRKLSASLPLQKKKFDQKRIGCFFNSGFLFYAEYNLRLFLFLLFKKMDAVCAIDLDTILPCLFISGIKKIPRVYDAHEYFTELKEVRTRPQIKKAWLSIERFAVPKYQNGYTVSEGLAQLFQKNYGRHYRVIRNLPVLKELPSVDKKEKILLYQGAVNEARGFEYLIPAMQSINHKLVICGDGNFMNELKRLIDFCQVNHKIELKGMLLPDQLQLIAQQASLGIGLAEKEGLNQWFALPNKFLEYMHAGLPQISMAYPEYKKINDRYHIAVLLQELSMEIVAQKINDVINDDAMLNELRANALEARKLLCWQNEEAKLIEFYKEIFHGK
jgi:glycosyltransferase involved in cell wall biosynthesis